MADDLSATRLEHSSNEQQHIQSFQTKIAAIQEKLTRLTTAYTENVIDLA